MVLYKVTLSSNNLNIDEKFFFIIAGSSSIAINYSLDKIGDSTINDYTNIHIEKICNANEIIDTRDPLQNHYKKNSHA